MKNIIIRNAVIADRERIRPLQREIAELHFSNRPDLFKETARFFTEEAFAERINDPKHTVLIAEADDGIVAGYAFAWVISQRNHPVYSDFDCFYIEDLCVLKSHQKMGIGKKLIERCRQIAEEKNCKMIDFGVWSFNKNAISFFESLGFTERVRKMEYMLQK